MRLPLVISLFFALVTHTVVLAQAELNVPAGAQLILQSGATVSVNGHLTLANGGSINNAGTITVNRNTTAADFTDNNIVPQNYGNGKFIFSGGGAQQIQGSTFYNLEINNAAGVSMLTDQTVNNNLNLISGSLYMGAHTLSLNGPVTGTGKLKGSALSNLVIGGNAGTLNFDQTDSASRSLKDFTFSNGSAVLGNALQVYRLLGLTASTFNLNNQSFVLKSTGNGVDNTARVGNLTGSTLSNASNVTVERYIASPQRAWHLLSAQAVTGSQTIKQAWQENGGPVVAGQGTLITSNLYNGGNGFDAVSVSASILTHNQGGLAGASYNYNLANTNTTVISSFPGYMLFVRGDRTNTTANAPATGPTVLRTHGILTQGNQSAFISSTGSGRTLVANPYASPIDMENIFVATSNLAPDMYIWDPALTGNYGVGGFRLVERTGPGIYQQTPVVLGGGPAADATARYIHSGQAFFLRTTGTAGTTDATVQFTEGDKAGSVSVVNPIVNGISDQQLIVNLMLVNAGNIESLADGIRVRFDDGYLADNSDDIEKMGNFAENISSYRNGKKFIVEKRPMIHAGDTIFLRITNTAIKNYRFQMGTLNFVQAGVVAFLQDNYLGTNTPIDLSGAINNIDFSITADAASAAADRFRIVFNVSGPLPVSSLTIHAYQQDKDIAVQWKVVGELDVNHYEVERSGDGIHFSQAGLQTATGNTNSTVFYQWTDMNPVSGNAQHPADNFYRIRSVSNSGEIKYSDIVKVTIADGTSSITIYPNPVTAKVVNVVFKNMDKGLYRLQLINNLGQVVLVQQVNHTGSNTILPVKLNGVAAGTYLLEIIKPDNTKIVKGLIVAH
jgi:hypothetical protein